MHETAARLAANVIEADLGPRGLTVAIVGLGYVGLPTALALVSDGVSVVGLDVSARRLAAIRRGDVDLGGAERTCLERALRRPGLLLTSDASRLTDADAVIVCVPTPVDEHLVPDLAPLTAACATVVANARPLQTIVLTSTTYVGTTRQLLAEPLSARGLEPGRDIFVAFSPERIDPGNRHRSQNETPRVVGGVTPECAARAADVIARVAPTHTVGSPEAAELTKLYENTFRAVNIALANELADIAGALGVDVAEVIAAASTKPYGFMPFWPGAGVGGHCIPCDPHYLLWQLRAKRERAPVIEQAMESIAARPRRVVDRARELLADVRTPLRRARIAVVGVAYKPGVRDVRESPAIEIMSRLAALGAAVDYHDPLVEQVRLADGTIRRSVAEPIQTDLAIVHTLHEGMPPTWLRRCPLVLDTTYRLHGMRTATP